jgi:hypothetical protein
VRPQPVGQLGERLRPRPLLAAVEQGDGAAVVGTGGQRSADRALDDVELVLAAEHQHVDHLAGRLGGPDPPLDQRPELVEAVRPPTPLALLAQRQRVAQRAGLALEQLEVVVEPGRAQLAAPQPRVAGHLAAVVEDLDLARPDPGGDPQPHQPHRHRVVVAADRDHRLLIDPVA